MTVAFDLASFVVGMVLGLSVGMVLLLALAAVGAELSEGDE